MLKSANKTETNIYTLEVAVSAEDFKAAVLKAYNKQKNKIQLPGFRKGKAPLAMIEKFYGKEVFYEDALDIVYPETVGAAIEEAGINPVAPPHDVEVTKMDETGVEMTLKITVMPEITIDGYKGIEANKGDASVTADDVKKELASMQERNSRTITVEDARKAKKNDIAVIDFEGFVDGVAFDGGKGENFDLTLGSGQFIPGFEDQVIGKKAGEEFDVNVTFPTEYAPELAGKDATFKVKIHELKVKELPALDDEFAKDVSEFDTLAELKKSIKADLVKTKTEQINREFESAILEKVVELVEGEIPEVMYDNKLEDDVKEYEQRLAQQGIGLDIREFTQIPQTLQILAPVIHISQRVHTAHLGIDRRLLGRGGNRWGVLSGQCEVQAVFADGKFRDFAEPGLQLACDILTVVNRLELCRHLRQQNRSFLFQNSNKTIDNILRSNHVIRHKYTPSRTV